MWLECHRDEQRIDDVGRTRTASTSGVVHHDVGQELGGEIPQEVLLLMVEFCIAPTGTVLEVRMGSSAVHDLDVDHH